LIAGSAQGLGKAIWNAGNELLVHAQEIRRSN
jgi:hypothetical protein